jgi:hypothetical protein
MKATLRRIRSILLSVLLSTAAFECASLGAAPEDVSSDAIYVAGGGEMEKIAALGQGAHSPKYTKDGKLISLKVVGSSFVPKSLGPGKGLEIAQERATQAAHLELLKWFKNNPSSISTSLDSTKVNITQNQEEGTNSFSSEKDYKSSLDNIIRGLTLIGKSQDENTLHLVFGWSSKNAKMAREAEEINRGPIENKGGSGDSKVDKAPPKLKYIISKDFDEF